MFPLLQLWLYFLDLLDLLCDLWLRFDFLLLYLLGLCQYFRLFDGRLWDGDFFPFQIPQKIIKVDVDTIGDAAAVVGLFSERNPVRQRKVDSLRDVEAEVEARVVGGGARYHELTLLVQALGHFDAFSPQRSRVDYRIFVADELLASLVVLWVLAVHEALEFLVVGQVDRVPELGLAMVQIIDRI